MLTLRFVTSRLNCLIKPSLISFELSRTIFRITTITYSTFRFRKGDSLAASAIPSSLREEMSQKLITKSART